MNRGGNYLPDFQALLLAQLLRRLRALVLLSYAKKEMTSKEYERLCLVIDLIYFMNKKLLLYSFLYNIWMAKTAIELVKTITWVYY